MAARRDGHDGTDGHDEGMDGDRTTSLEALWKRSIAFRALRERMEKLIRPGRLGSIKTYGMVWYVMYVSKNKHKEDLGTLYVCMYVA